MNLITQKCENETEHVLQRAVSAFGLTFQGTSHKQSQPPVPCQDYHDLRWLEQEGILLAAIADGVGSCKLSHWGAYTAVNASLDSVEKALKAMSRGKKLQLDADAADFRQQMKQIMLRAFRTAQSTVERLADNAQPPQAVFSFQSTLTLAIYDGVCLYHAHAGDDGIVAQLPDGTVEMATRRMKGDEANSVYPLQSGENAWSFGVVPEVSGFVMATDGVLDAFVQSHRDYFGFNYFNGICYAFMEEAMKQLAQKTPGAAEQAKEQYSQYLQSAEYTSQVTDDLTMVAVVSPKMMQRSQKPNFSLELWDTIARESVNAKRKALNHRVSQPQDSIPQTPKIPKAMDEYPIEFAEPVRRKPSKKKKKASGISTGLVVALATLLLVQCLLMGFLTVILYRQREAYTQIVVQYQESEQRLKKTEQKVVLLQQELRKYVPMEESVSQKNSIVDPFRSGLMTQEPSDGGIIVEETTPPAADPVSPEDNAPPSAETSPTSPVPPNPEADAPTAAETLPPEFVFPHPKIGGFAGQTQKDQRPQA